MELAIVARMLQARLRATEVRYLHPRFAPLIGLFIGCTAALADAAAGLEGGLGDTSATALMSGPDVRAFLISRGLLEASAPSLAMLAELTASEDYLLAERIHLGTLMDMISSLLDAMDFAFDLYAAPRAAA